VLYSASVDAIVGNIVNNAISSVAGTYEMRMEQTIGETLLSLKQEVLKIQSIITEAERRRIPNQKLLEWFATLIDIAFQADYTLDTFTYWYLLSSTDNEQTTQLSVSSSYHPAKRICTSTEALRKLLLEGKEVTDLHGVLKRLKSIDVSVFMELLKGCQPVIYKPVNVYLYMDHNVMFGRHVEREQILNFLFEPGMAGERNVNILPIIGYEGVGKTTLILHCYYNPKVQTHFSLKIYTCCRDFRIDIIVKRILQIYNKTNDSTEYDNNTLLVMLKQYLSTERFLLILEDFTEINCMVWNVLYDCLRCGKEGSKIIITSCYRDIVILGTVKPIILNYFSKHEYWFFFKEHAFGNADPKDYPELAILGRELATKMNGSNWGAKILGELLRENLNARYWSHFLQDGIVRSKFTRKDLRPIICTGLQKLPMRPKLIKWAVETTQKPSWSNRQKSKTFRELVVPCSYHTSTRPGDAWAQNRVELFVTKKIVLSPCTLVIVEVQVA
jgi:NB-ARC domain/Rx N-terminal domain